MAHDLHTPSEEPIGSRITGSERERPQGVRKHEGELTVHTHSQTATKGSLTLKAVEKSVSPSKTERSSIFV